MRQYGAIVATAVALLSLASADAASAVTSFFKAPMSRQTFVDFLAAQDFLKSRSPAGRVAPYSGRYFYLLTPILSGRGLINEAFNSHLMLRGVAELQRASFLSQQEFNTFSDVAGVSHILIDKRDPDTPGVLQETLRSLAPVVFENDHFVVLENSRAFYPAAFAMNSFSIDEPPAEIASRSLKAAANGILAISRRTKFADTDRSGIRRRRLPQTQRGSAAGDDRANNQKGLTSTRKEKLVG